tara:strand:+ start:306 stop:476 length:171 start_codon:yes stop_codon:yes gene_type:complete
MKVKVIKALTNGIVKIIKAINCRIACCCESQCSQPTTNLGSLPPSPQPSLKTIAEV